jgi:hypothetical protein
MFYHSLSPLAPPFAAFEVLGDDVGFIVGSLVMDMDIDSNPCSKRSEVCKLIGSAA